ncbi:hypothetical protein P9112_000446 [Eukaryota sp. TZLM1-RC]
MPLTITNLDISDLQERESRFNFLTEGTPNPLFSSSITLKTPKAVISLGTPRELLLDAYQDRIAQPLTSKLCFESPVFESPMQGSEIEECDMDETDSDSEMDMD